MQKLKREGVRRLFIVKPNIINMNVHSATCSCSIELYKHWYSLADFFPNWNISRAFFIYN
jgi:hypothetical protein